MINKLREIADHVLNIEEQSPIKSVEHYYKAKNGEEIPVPIHVETVDKLLKYYESLDYETVVIMYLDLCDTLDSARDQPSGINVPHIISYNKSIALAIIINNHMKSEL